MGRYRLGFDTIIIPFRAASFLKDKTKSRANALDFVYSLRPPYEHGGLFSFPGKAGKYSRQGRQKKQFMNR